MKENGKNPLNECVKWFHIIYIDAPKNNIIADMNKNEEYPENLQK